MRYAAVDMSYIVLLCRGFLRWELVVELGPELLVAAARAAALPSEVLWRRAAAAVVLCRTQHRRPRRANVIQLFVLRLQPLPVPPARLCLCVGALPPCRRVFVVGLGEPSRLC